MRIDIEGGSAPLADAPEVGSSSNGSGQFSSPIVILGVLVLAVIGVTLFLLRPAENAAADGTIREAPTTTVVDGADAPDSVEDDAGVAELQQAPDLEFPDERRFRPVPINTPVVPTSIVSVDNGFLGLARGVSLTPTILRSVDGVDWRMVDTAADTIGIAREWETLTNPGGQLQIQSKTVDGEFHTDIYQSADGLDWRQVVEIGSLGGPPLPELPVIIQEESYLAVGFGGAEILDRFLRDHTTLPVEESGACFIVVSRSTDESRRVDLVITDCESSDDDQLLESGVIASEFSDEEVLACGQVLASAGVSGAIIEQEFDGNGSGDRTIVDFVVTDAVVPLPDTDLAMIDGGFTVLQRVELCDGLANVRAGSQPSIVHVDAQTNEVTRWPLPGNPAPRDPAVTEAFVLGQVQLDTDATALLVAYNDALWSIDIATGVWVEIFVGTVAEDLPLGGVGFDIDFRPLNGEVLLSESGTRVYSVADGKLLAVFLDPTSPVASGWTWDEIPSSIDGFSAEEILFADDTALFVSTGDDVVRLAAPLR